jgi:hypothetical protein
MCAADTRYWISKWNRGIGRDHVVASVGHADTASKPADLVLKITQYLKCSCVEVDRVLLLGLKSVSKRGSNWKALRVSYLYFGNRIDVMLVADLLLT